MLGYGNNSAALAPTRSQCIFFYLIIRNWVNPKMLNDVSCQRFQKTQLSTPLKDSDCNSHIHRLLRQNTQDFSTIYTQT